MGQLNRVASGFLDLVGNIAQGKSPPAFSDAVAPVVDMNEFYYKSTLGHYGIDAVHSAAPANFVMTIPENELWLLRGLSITVVGITQLFVEDWTVGLGGTPRVSDNDEAAAGPGLIWAPDRIDKDTADRSRSAAIMFGHPLLLGAGSNLVWRLENRTNAGSRTTQLRALFSLLRG